ncbi:DNA polymerase III subunit delta' [Brevundimonas sp.]|uniref:DNA polymerase III subunit delta' n=1 Tax=Brevundimonas sp. TaxID=1871086 RepID=UPI0035B215F3
MSEHPRDAFDTVPAPEAEAAFLDALDRGRLHHAWLLTGAQGRGKATFAFRAARRLLGARPAPQRGPLGARPDDPVSRLVTAQSHPDLMVLERAIEGGKVKKSISVDQARELPEFFSMSPSVAAWRVAIVDAADDLNPNAANALLKILEEPPEKGVVFLVSHAPGRLLPTIRSRCRRLAFPAWTEDRLFDLVRDRLGATEEAARAAAAMAQGSPGQALALAGAAASELDQLARRWIAEGPRDAAETISLADSFRKGDGAQRFDMLFDRLRAAAREQAVAAGQGGVRWAELWSRLGELPDQVAGLNLDRGEALAVAVSEIERARRQSGRAAA